MPDPMYTVQLPSGRTVHKELSDEQVAKLAKKQGVTISPVNRGLAGEAADAGQGAQTAPQQADDPPAGNGEQRSEAREWASNLGRRALNVMGAGATEGGSAALATNPMDAYLSMSPVYRYLAPDALKSALTGWADVNPHEETGIPVTYAQDPQREMHQALERDVDEARAATEFGTQVPEGVPIVGGMSAGGLFFDAVTGLPQVAATGGAGRVANAATAAVRSGLTRDLPKKALGLGKKALQAGKEAAPWGAVMGLDEPVEDPEWELPQRMMNALGSAGAAAIFGPAVVGIGRLLGSPATGIVNWLRNSTRQVGDSGQMMGRAVRDVEYARELEGQSPSVTGITNPVSPKPPGRVEAALEAATTDKGVATPNEVLRAELMGDFPGEMGMMSAERERVRQGLDVASAAAQSEAKTIETQARNAFEGFVSKAATKLNGALTKSKERMNSELRSYFDSSPEASKVVSAAPLSTRLRRMWEEGVSEGSPNPFTAAPEFEKEMKKALVTEAFVDDGGKMSEKMFAQHSGAVDTIPYARAKDRGLKLGEDSEIAAGIKKWEEWKSGDGTGLPPKGAIDPANVTVAVRPKTFTPVALDTIIRSLNEAINAPSNRGRAPANLKELHAAAMEMRKEFPQLESMKGRHSNESAEYSEALQSLGVEGFKDLTEIPPQAAVRSRLREALLESADTPERQGALKALKLAGMGDEIAQMESAEVARADLGSMVNTAGTLGADISARQQLRGQMFSGDPVAQELSGMLTTGGQAMQGAMGESAALRSLAEELGMNPNGILDAPEAKIADDMMKAVWEYKKSDNRVDTLEKQFGSDSEFIKRVKETVPAMRSFLALTSGQPSAHMTSAGGSGHLWGSMGMHHAGFALDPYARMLTGVSPQSRFSGRGEAGLVDAAPMAGTPGTSTPAEVQEQIDAIVEWLQAFDERLQREDN